MLYLRHTHACQAAHDRGDRRAALVHVKDTQAAIRAARADRSDGIASTAVYTHVCYRVLVRGV